MYLVLESLEDEDVLLSGSSVSSMALVGESSRLNLAKASTGEKIGRARGTTT